MTGESSHIPRNNPPTRFTAEFICPKCGYEIHIITFLAIVQGPGLERQCPTCGQMFLITEEGATPTTETVRDFLDAAGQPYRPAMPSDPPIQPRLPEGNE
jgi:predicted RNA-binding Zn-ribbon protein involved in translation (DUF1610 family)